MSIRTGVPVDLDRESAAELARRELSEPAYAEDRPGLLERLLQWVVERLDDLLYGAAAASPGGSIGWVVLALLLAVLAGTVILRTGTLTRSRRGSAALFGAADRTAADHRRDAEALAARGEWAPALRERLRALVRGLEERGVLERRPGRTADEVARDAGAALPASAAALQEAARLFDEVWYGGRPATAAAYRRLSEVDDEVSARHAPVRA